jgi:hypothetical protein
MPAATQDEAGLLRTLRCVEQTEAGCTWMSRNVRRVVVTTINYRVMRSDGAWLIAQADTVIGPYPTRAAACRAAIGPVSAAIARGNTVSFTIAPTTT